MTEKYEQTGETAVEHARANKIRGISSCFEVAVSKETFDSLISFARSRNTMSMSFEASLEGYTELFTLYRFTNEEKTRMNIFLHTDKFGYEELISINTFGPNDVHVNAVSVENHSYSFYSVDDIDRHEVAYLIGHVLERIIKLNNIVSDPEEKEITEVMYEYGRMLREKYI